MNKIIVLLHYQTSRHEKIIVLLAYEIYMYIGITGL